MKIAVNTRLLLPNRMEGIARYIYETTRQMVLEHPEVEFHFLFDRPYDKKFLFADNVVAHVLGPPSRHPILWYLWFEKSIPQFFNKHKIDAFYSGDMYLSLKAKVPTLYVSHDLNYIHYPKGLRWSHLKYYKKYMPLFHKTADAIISVSEATKNDVINQYGIDSAKILVAGNALPSEIKREEEKQNNLIRNKLTEGAPYFCYVGSLHPRKNIERLILAFEKFKSETQSNQKLVLYGRNAWKTSGIFKIYNASKYKADIVFSDAKNCTVSEVLSASTALCYISLFEGFGIPILEAFACETPVITSNVSSMPEVAGDAALLVDPKSTKSISDAMIKVVDEVELGSKLITKGLERLRHYSWKSSSQIIFDALQNLAQKK